MFESRGGLLKDMLERSVLLKDRDEPELDVSVRFDRREKNLDKGMLEEGGLRRFNSDCECNEDCVSKDIWVTIGLFMSCLGRLDCYESGLVR